MRYRTSHEFGVPLIMVSALVMLTHWAIQGRPAPVVHWHARRVWIDPVLAQMVALELGLLVLAWSLATCWLLTARHNARVAMPARHLEHPIRGALGWAVPVLGWWDVRGIVEHCWRVARAALPYGHVALHRYRVHTRLWWFAGSGLLVASVLVAAVPAEYLHRLLPAWVPLQEGPVRWGLRGLEVIALLAWARAVWALGQVHEALVTYQRDGYLRRFEALPTLPGSTATVVMVRPRASTRG
jgi:hypothetical protein